MLFSEETKSGLKMSTHEETQRPQKKSSRITTSRRAPVITKKSDEPMMDHARWDEIAVFRNYLYFTKLTTSIVLGFVTALLYTAGFQNPEDFGGIAGTLWFVILLSGLAISFAVLRYGFQVTEEDMSTKDLLLKATFTYVIAFIAVSSMVWMILMSGDLQPLIDIALP